MAVSSMTSKGQITIPKSIRDRLNLRVGDKVDFEMNEDGSVRLRPLSRSVTEVYGMLRRPEEQARSAPDMDKELKRAMKRGLF